MLPVMASVWNESSTLPLITGSASSPSQAAVDTAPGSCSTSLITGITGQIRAGRTLEQKQKLIKQICSSWSEITGQPQKQVVAGLTEIDSDVTMEYGLILPHPGGEPEWFAKNAEALDGISGTGL